MAVVRRYFSTTGAGAADGTSWANRAALFSAGAWSTIITGFNFTSDSLEAYVGPGSYSISAVLSTWSSTAPSQKFPCFLIACDSSGNKWTAPNPDWVAAMPDWDTTGMPVLTGTTNSVINHAGVALEGLVIASAVNGTVINGLHSIRWCVVSNTGNNAGGAALGGSPISMECVIAKCTGTAYDKVCGSAPAGVAVNVRVVGNLSATSGNRHGWQTSNNATYSFLNLVVINNKGYAVAQTTANTGVSVRSTNLLVWNSSSSGTSDGIYNNGTSTNVGHLRKAIVCNVAGYGLNVANTNKLFYHDCFFRDCASGNINDTSSMPLNSETVTETDSQLFVDHTNLDLRIKNTSAYWGRGIGAGDEP